MSRALLVSVAVLVPLSLSACPAGVPSELRPLTPQIVLLPSLAQCTVATADSDCGAGNACDRTSGAAQLCHDPTPQEATVFSVRNVGDKVVNISGVSFTGTDAAAFTEAEANLTELYLDNVSSVRFTYLTSDIFTPLSATLVIASDAEVNPSLEVPVSTVAFDDGST